MKYVYRPTDYHWSIYLTLLVTCLGFVAGAFYLEYGEHLRYPFHRVLPSVIAVLGPLINIALRRGARVTVTSTGMSFSGPSSGRTRDFLWREVVKAELVPWRGLNAAARVVLITLDGGAICYFPTSKYWGKPAFESLEADSPTLLDAVAQYCPQPLVETGVRRMPADAGVEGNHILIVLPAIFLACLFLNAVVHVVGNWPGRNGFLLAAGLLSLLPVVWYMRRTHIGITFTIGLFVAPVAAWFCYLLLQLGTISLGPIAEQRFQVIEDRRHPTWVALDGPSLGVLNTYPADANAPLGTIRQVPVSQGPAGLQVVSRGTYLDLIGDVP